MNQESPSCLNKVSIFIFSNLILLKDVGTGSLVQNIVRNHKILKWPGKIFTGISLHKYLFGHQIEF